MQPAHRPSDLVNQANAPISSLFQIRLQDAYAPAFQGQLRGQGNSFSIAVGMPLPQYRLLPFPQLSLLTIPAAVTLPLPLGSSTGFGDIRFVDLAILDAGHSLLLGSVLPLYFPLPTNLPAVKANGRLDRRLPWHGCRGIGCLECWRKIRLHSREIRSPRMRTPCFFNRSLPSSDMDGFVRSEPQMIFDWETNKQQLPIDAGIGRVFKFGRQYVNTSSSRPGTFRATVRLRGT